MLPFSAPRNNNTKLLNGHTAPTSPHRTNTTIWRIYSVGLLMQHTHHVKLCIVYAYTYLQMYHHNRQRVQNSVCLTIWFISFIWLWHDLWQLCFIWVSSSTCAPSTRCALGHRVRQTHYTYISIFIYTHAPSVSSDHKRILNYIWVHPGDMGGGEGCDRPQKQRKFARATNFLYAGKSFCIKWTTIKQL